VSTAEEVVRDAWRRVAGAHRTEGLERLLGHYREPHRHYHTVAHLAAVLQAIDELVAHCAAHETPHDPEAVLLAALYHDAVYDPTAAGNEAASAVLAGHCADELGWTASRRSEVERLVRATADHVATDADAAVLIDADLSVLAADPVAYSAYASAVRAEYAHVDAARWASGRAAVLRALLDRDHLFHTAQMRATAESRARANIAAELATLSHP
jgi:predicted metal-dependent HD superfamily phosphohydrolase